MGKRTNALVNANENCYIRCPYCGKIHTKVNTPNASQTSIIDAVDTSSQSPMSIFCGDMKLKKFQLEYQNKSIYIMLSNRSLYYSIQRGEHAVYVFHGFCNSSKTLCKIMERSVLKHLCRETGIRYKSLVYRYQLVDTSEICKDTPNVITNESNWRLPKYHFRLEVISCDDAQSL